MRTSAFDSPKAASHGRRQQHFIGAENIDNLRRNLASCQEALQTTRCWQQDTQCALDQTVQQLQWVLNTLAQRDGELAVAGRTFTAQETELRRCRALLKKRTVAMKEEEAAKHIYGQALKVERLKRQQSETRCQQLEIEKAALEQKILALQGSKPHCYTLVKEHHQAAQAKATDLTAKEEDRAQPSAPTEMKPSMSAFSAPTSEHLLAAAPVSSATSYHSATSSVKSSSPAAQSDEDEDILRLLMGDAYRPVKRHSHYTCTTTAAEGTAMQDAPMQPAPTTDSQMKPAAAALSRPSLNHKPTAPRPFCVSPRGPLSPPQSEDEEHNLQHVPEVAQRPVQDKASQPALPTGEQACIDKEVERLRREGLQWKESCKVAVDHANEAGVIIHRLEADNARQKEEFARLQMLHDRCKEVLNCAGELPIIPQSVYEAIEWRGLSAGGWGSVSFGNLPVALKLPIQNDDVYQQALDTEGVILQALSHPNVIRPMAFVDCGGGVHGFLMEHFANNLADCFRPQGPGSTLPLQVQMRCILQIIDGVKHAHGKDLYNCDLKLENILMRADGSLVVADWGLTVRNNQALAAFTATVGYAAPEGVLQPTTPRRYDEYGVLSMAWALFTGEHPYEKLWRQYEALTACEKARVEKAVTDSALDCGSVHHRLGLAVYLNAIPGIDHVVPPRPMPECAVLYKEFLEDGMFWARSPAARNEFGLDLLRDHVQALLTDLVEEGLEAA